METSEKSREYRGEVVSAEIQPVVVLACRMLVDPRAHYRSEGLISDEEWATYMQALEADS